MVRFGRRLLGFTLLFLIIVICINLTSKFAQLKYYWGNEPFSDKLTSYQKIRPIANTFFFGSSMTNSHIDPILFDSLVNQTSISSISYNLGVPAGGNPEHYFLFENFIKESEKGPRFVFLELTRIMAKDPRNLTLPRSHYWLNPNTISYLLQTVKEEDYPLKTKIYRMGSFLISYSVSFLSLSWFDSTYSERKKRSEEKGVMGFYGLKLSDKKTKGFKKILNRKTPPASKFHESPDTTKINKSHLAKLKQLIQTGKKFGTKVLFVLPPRLGNYDQLLATIKKIPDEHIINLANPDEYPLFYEPVYLNDPTHFNSSGAKLYTKALAKEFIRIQKNDN